MESLLRRRGLLIVLMLALLARAGVFAINHPFPPPGKDDAVYDALAWNLTTGHGFSTAAEPPYAPMAARTPAYPAFLAGIYTVAGRSTDVVRVVQILLSLVTCWLVFLLGRRLMNERYGLLAAGVYALLPAAAQYPSLLLTEANQALVLTAATYCAYRIVDEPARWSWYGALAALLAVATLMRPDTQLLIGPLLAVVILVRPSLKVVGPRALAACALFALLLSPWIVRNYMTFHQYVGLATGSGHTMLVGELEAEGFTHQKLIDELDRRYGAEFRRKYGRTMTHLDGTLPGEDERRRHDAVALIESDPANYAEHSLERVATLWGPRSWSDLVGLEADFSDYRTHHQFTALAAKAVLLLVDGLVIALAIVGLLWSLADFRRFAPVVIVPLYFTAIYGLVYSGARYRVPFLPLVAIAAVYGLQRLVVSLTTLAGERRAAARADREAVLAVAASSEGRRP
jgi:4-amino-4-deoxy-L-arabinose transferase-like glycosyltransferase